MARPHPDVAFEALWQIERMSSQALAWSFLPHAEELTVRETQVVQLILMGASYKDIALALGMKRSTLATHLRSIRTKTELANGFAAYLLMAITKVAHGAQTD